MYDAITDVAGITVGHSTDQENEQAEHCNQQHVVPDALSLQPLWQGHTLGTAGMSQAGRPCPVLSSAVTSLISRR